MRRFFVAIILLAAIKANAQVITATTFLKSLQCPHKSCVDSLMLKDNYYYSDKNTQVFLYILQNADSITQAQNNVFVLTGGDGAGFETCNKANYDALLAGFKAEGFMLKMEMDVYPGVNALYLSDKYPGLELSTSRFDINWYGINLLKVPEKH